MNGEMTTEKIKVRLPNNVEACLEVTPLGGEERIGFKVPDFSQIIGAIEGIAAAINGGKR